VDDEADPTTARPEGGYFRRVAVIRHVRFGSLADLLTDFSLTAALGWKADVQTARNRGKLGSAFGHKRSYSYSNASVSIICLLVPSVIRQAQRAYQ